MSVQNNIKKNVSGHGAKIKLTKEEKIKVHTLLKDENEKLFQFIGKDFGSNDVDSL